MYLNNAEAYSEQLDILFAWGEEAMSQVPEDQRYLITSHDAFQYFGDAFGWQVIAVQGISTEAEAGVGDIQAIVDTVIDYQIPVIFVESSVPVATIEAVQAAVEAAGYEVSVGIRPLYSDAMGNAGTFGGTYIGMIAENIYTILQSYQAAGFELTIPAYPEDLLPAAPINLIDFRSPAP